jgi:hypothetical protein
MSRLNENLKDAFLKGYRVSKDGVVISPRGKMLYCTTSSWGYKRFTIRNATGNRVTVMVHKLMAYQKFGEDIFREGIVVRHLDGVPGNNKPNNILIGSFSDNMLDRSEDARKETAKYAAGFLIKYDACKIKSDREMGMTYLEIMRKYNIPSKGTVSYIVNNR